MLQEDKHMQISKNEIEEIRNEIHKEIRQEMENMVESMTRNIDMKLDRLKRDCSVIPMVIRPFEFGEMPYQRT